MTARCAAPLCTNEIPEGSRRRYCSQPCQNVKHGLYRKRTRHCEAPGCGREYTTARIGSRFCSQDCQTNFGAWSYPVAHHTNARVFGTTQG